MEKLKRTITNEANHTIEEGMVILECKQSRLVVIWFQNQVFSKETWYNLS